MNAEIVARLEASNSVNGEEIEKWKRLYEDEHKAYERLDALYEKSQTLNVSAQTIVRSTEAQIMRMAHHIEWLSAVVLSLEGPPTVEIAKMVENTRQSSRKIVDSLVESDEVEEHTKNG